MLDEKRIAGTHLAPYLRNVDVQWNYVNTADLPEMDFSAEDRERFALRSGDLLVCEGGEVGRTALWDGRLSECYFQKAIHRLRPITENDEPRFFRYFMQMAVRSGLFALSTASTIQHLPAEKLRVVRYPSPPRWQQCAIADYLDRETARLDALVAAKDRLLELLAEKRRALITRAVTRGLDPRAPLRDSGIPWLGEIPAHWRLIQFKHVTTRVDVGIAEAATHAYAPAGVPLIRSTNLRDGTINTSDMFFIDERFAEKNRSKYLFAGDIVSVRTGNTGVSAVVPATLNRSQCFTMLISTLSHANMPEFFCHFLNSDAGQRYFQLEALGTAQDNISVPILKDMPVAVPLSDEQRVIVAYIGRETAKLDAVRAANERTIALLKERRAALIAAAVTGKIDVREAVA